MFLLQAALAVGVAGAHPTELRCEYLANPIAIDVAAPRLSWKLAVSDRHIRNVRQSAYRILVSSDPHTLATERGDLWDSGKTESSDSTAIEYKGAPLQSGRPYWWKVKIWDGAGSSSDWSPAASWSMGLLNASDWKGTWIGYDAPVTAPTDVPSFRGASWIWSTHQATEAQMPETRYLRKTIQIPADVASVHLLATCDDEYDLSIDGHAVAADDKKFESWKRPADKEITAALPAGSHMLLVKAVNTGGDRGFLAELLIKTKDGKISRILTDSSWEASVLEAGPWEPAKVLASYGDGPWGKITNGLVLPPPRYLRTQFEVTKPVKRAVLYGTALGLIQLHLNGKSVSKDLFTPGWTDYNKRIYYSGYDVTSSLKQGVNGLGAVLGDGWYAGYVGYGRARNHYGENNRVMVQLDVEYTDGAHEVIASNPNWKATTGPMLESDFLQGETYDARKELGDWATGHFTDAAWHPVDVTDKVSADLEAFPGVPVRPYTELHAQKITSPKADTYILNLGQNMAGFARLKVKGTAGQKITLRFAEMLNPDGTLYTTNLRSARAIDTYVCKGNGVEVWEPSFTFHGFQYIEVSGLGHQPAKDEVVGVAISSDAPIAGHLETSDWMMNKLVSNALWTQHMNFIDTPTDCPQRDERLGWTGDAQAYIRTACMSADVHTFFKKWLVALDDAQRSDGQFPMVAPLKVAEGDGGPAWADAGTICPWTIYDVYGDKRQLAEHYPQMKRFVEFMVKRSTSDLLPPKQYHCFGDWLSIDEETPNDVIYEAYFALSTELLAKSATVLGYTEDAEHYRDLHARIRTAFQKAYFADGKVTGDSQCGYVLALQFELLEPDQAKVAAQRLADKLEARGWRLTTGFVGTRDVMHALSKIGRDDIAYRLLHSTQFPSWGFCIKNGATSIWERWDGWTPEKGFQDPGMNSFAHYAYGAVVSWMYAHIAGIDNLTPGFEKVRIAPAIDPNLTFAKGSYDSIRGKIVSNWEVKGGKLKMHVVIPPNTTAEIHVPTTGDAAAIKASADLKPTTVGNKVATFEVGSGEYEFESAYVATK